MRRTILKLLGGGAIAAVMLAAAAPSQAQTYPDHAIRLISPYEPGGGTDALARAIGAELEVRLGQPVVIDNRPGGGGTIGMAIAATSEPDGYTIVMASPSPIVVAPHLQSDLSYDPLVDLAPITLISVVPSILAVHPSVPVTTVQELIDYAKAHPGELTFGSSGPGGSGHLAGEMFKMMAGVDMLHIPYTGTGPATQALIAGEVDVLFGNMISLLPQVEAGTVRAIALSTPERSPLVPDLPTVSETVPGYAAGPWYGLLAPGGTPPDIIAKLNAEVVAILKSPEMSQRLSSEGAEPSGNTPEEFAAFLREETDRWGKVVAEAGITAD